MIKFLLFVFCFLCKLFNFCIKSILFIILPKTRKDINSDIVLITGGGKGIGREIALYFTKYQPAHIILWGRTNSCLQQTAETVQELGVKCTPMVCDVSEKEKIYECAKQIQTLVGDVSILVNNAGVVQGKSVVNSSENEIENTFKVNTLSHFWTLKCFLPGMIEKNHGHIVEISSVLGLMGLKDTADYCSSKFAVTGLTESLYDELNYAHNNHIRLTTIHPYIVGNDMFSGIKTRLSWLIPPLSEKYVAQKTVEAVLTNRYKVIMPRLMYVVIFMTSLFPMRVQHHLVKLTGADKAMINFHHKH